VVSPSSRDVFRYSPSLETEQDLLSSPLGVPHPMCKKEKLMLIAWRLYGIAGVAEDFRPQLSSSLLPERAMPRILLIQPPGKLGSVGAYRGISIPCKLL